MWRCYAAKPSGPSRQNAELWEAALRGTSALKDVNLEFTLFHFASEEFPSVEELKRSDRQCYRDVASLHVFSPPLSYRIGTGKMLFLFRDRHTLPMKPRPGFSAAKTP